MIIHLARSSLVWFIAGTQRGFAVSCRASLRLFVACWPQHMLNVPERYVVEGLVC